MNGKERISITHADITTLAVDAIVNAANRTLLGGGGVDGAIHKAAGEELIVECRGLNGCKTGEAKLTKGYKLPARYVIHTVGPIWRGGTDGEAEKLKSAYENSLQIARRHHFQTVAFSAISTGVYGYPARQATEIAVRTVIDFLDLNAFPLKVIFCCFSDEMTQLYHEVMNSISN